MPSFATSAAATSSCVESGFEAQSEERTLLGEELAYQGEHGQFSHRPRDAAAASHGETAVGDVVLRWSSADRHCFFSYRAPIKRSQDARRTAGPSMYGACVK